MDLHGQSHLVRDLRTGRTIQTEEDAARAQKNVWFCLVFDLENNFILFGTEDRGVVSELLELLGAGSLGNLEHVGAHCLAWGHSSGHHFCCCCCC